MNLNTTYGKIPAARQRSTLISALRDFFLAADYLEVDTPVLSGKRIPESHIELFRTRFQSPFTGDRDLCLLPSPEIWMKRLLAAGFPSCFQLCKSFRNAEQLGAHHNPEFTMLEWYTLDADYIDSLRLTRELLEYLGELFQGADFKAAAEIPMGEFFKKHTGIDLSRCADLKALKGEAAAKGHAAQGETWEEVFNALFLRHAEPELANYPAVFLYDYPAQISCLAAAGREPLVRQRWELYLGGIEIANCYTEERDGTEVAAFLHAEAAASPDAEVPASAEDLPEVSAAMPPCSGVALGVDRLLMALTGAKNIQDVLLFPFG